MTDPKERLEEKVRELHKAAQAEYDADPVMAVLEHLHDHLNDYESWDDGLARGYRQAVHDVQRMYLLYSDEFQCNCHKWNAALEKTNDGTWVCGKCGVIVSTELNRYRWDDEE